MTKEIIEIGGNIIGGNIVCEKFDASCDCYVCAEGRYFILTISSGGEMR